MTFVRRQPQRVLDPLEQRTRPRDQEGLLEQLYDANPQARRWAARDLAAYPETVPQLCARLPDEPEAAVQEALLTTLILLKGESAARGLIPLLRSENTALRNAVLEALQQMPEVIEPYMTALLVDTDPDLRIVAVDILQMLQHPEGACWLATVIASDPHVNVCAAAVDRLAEIGTPEMVPALRALVERFPDEPFMAFAVETAISRIAGVQTIESEVR